MRKTFWGLLLAVATISCAKVEEEPLYIPKGKVDVESVAVLISKMGVDAPICEEIFTGVTENAEWGWDETFYLDYQWNRNTKGVEMSSPFFQKLQDAIAHQTKGEGSDLSMDQLLSQNVRIYWPYSDNWDGVTEPVITFCPDGYEDLAPNEDISIVGYRLTGPDGTPEKVMVNEDYARKNPVWVIGMNGRKQTVATKAHDPGSDRMQDFQLKERIVDEGGPVGGGNGGGNTGGNNGGGNNGGGNTGSGKGKTIYVWKLVSFKFLEQYDCWFLGGPDFHFEVAYPIGPGMVGENMKYEFSLTRGQKDQWINVNVPLNENWTEEQRSNYLYVCEEDVNPNIKFDCELSWNIDLASWLTFKGKISYAASDEVIFSGPRDRDYVQSPELNNKEKKYDLKDGKYRFCMKLAWQEISF